MNSLLQLYKAILFIHSKSETGIPAVDTRTGEIVFLQPVGEGDNEVQVIPINSNSPTDIEFDMNPELYLTFDDFTEFNGNLRTSDGRFAALLRNFYGELTEALRNDNGAFTEALRTPDGISADDLRNDYGPDAENRRRLIGKGIIDRKPISHFYSGETAQILKKIERLTDKIVRNTEKEKTISRAGQLYDQATQLAQSKDNDRMIKLRKIKAALQLSSDRQDRRTEQNYSEQKQHSIAFKLKKLAWTAATVAGVFFTAWYYFSDQIPVIEFEYIRSESPNTPTEKNFEPEIKYNQPTNNVQNSTSKNESESIDRKKYNGSEIDNLIDVYAKDNGVKVWEYRRNKIKQDFAGQKLSPWEAKQTIMRHINKIK
jgi:hypothetical protein